MNQRSAQVGMLVIVALVVISAVAALLMKKWKILAASVVALVAFGVAAVASRRGSGRR